MSVGLLMAAATALDVETDRLCVVLVQPVRHLARCFLLELLAVSVLLRDADARDDNFRHTPCSIRHHN